MSSNVKAALILAVGIVIAAIIYAYFTPYQQCVRAEEANGNDQAKIACVNLMNSN